MHKNLEILLEVQKREQRLRELDEEIATLPKRVAAIEAQLNGVRQARERAQAAQGASQSERRQVEGEIESLRAKIVKIRSHSGDVKTNQEFKALTDEIAFAEAQIGKHEERVLEIMEQTDALGREAASAGQALEAQQAEVAQARAEAETQTAAVRRERKQVAQERDGFRSQVEDNWLRRFDRVVRVRHHAVTAVDREVCGGCRVRLRPQFLQEMAMQPERLFVCESCGRILYMEAEVIPN